MRSNAQQAMPYRPDELHLGREVSRAVGMALGLGSVTCASIEAQHDDVTRITITFIPTQQQMAFIGRVLNKEQQQ